jgi:hypothetical protein
MPRQFSLRRRTLEEVFLELAQDGRSLPDADDQHDGDHDGGHERASA